MPKKPDISAHYDSVADQYHQQYKTENLFDTTTVYPANYFRLQILINALIEQQTQRVIEVGVGEGTPLTTLAQAGMDVYGFDISTEMVKKSKQAMSNQQLDPNHIFYGDIQDPLSYAHCLKEGQFDALIAMGVMPHIYNDNYVLDNISSLIKPDGTVFIEFRNQLFSLFTFNKYTYDFILNDLLAHVDEQVKQQVAQDLQQRLRMDMPPTREASGSNNAPGYDKILSKFHNPFEVVELFKYHNFYDIKLHWYHYHPAMPYLAAQMPEQFREQAIALEHEASGWRGFFLCSAFVVQAKKR